MSKENSGNELLSNRLLEMISSGWISQALYVAAELCIADLLADGPKTSEELAGLTDTHAPSLHRLLLAMSAIDICKQQKNGAFEITPLGRMLETNSSMSLHHWTIWWGKHLWNVWGNLLYSIKTGKSARSMLLGTEGFNHLDQDPDAATTFNIAMEELTQHVKDKIICAYDFSGMKQIVDLGGGNGELLLSILELYPSAKGILFDQPHVLENARNKIIQAGLTSRCQCVTGDFFDTIPKDADIYILKSVIHDWNDELGKKILVNCRQAMGEKGKLLLIERVIPECIDNSIVHQTLMQIDLTMLVANAAQERTENQYRELLDSAGIKISEIYSTGSTFKIIEACSKY